LRIRFIGSGEPGEDAVCVVFGLAFPMGEWVSGEFPVKLLANPAFEVDRFNGAPPAAFDHDGDGNPGGSRPRGRKGR
jgi:hypothetical protein